MTSLLTCPWFMGGIAFVVGTLLGRLANRCIDVFPRYEALGDQLRAIWTFSPHENVLRKARSWFHWLPVVGWLLPENPLAPPRDRRRYAAIELANGLLLALLVWSQTPSEIAFGPHGNVIGYPVPFAVEGWEILAPSYGLDAWLFRFLLHGLLIEALLIASVIDLKLMIIPDGSTIPAMLLAVIISGLAGNAWLVPLWYEHTGLVAALSGSMANVGFGEIVVPGWIADYPHAHGLLVSLAGLLVGGGTIWAVRIVGHWALGREAMGFGDVVLMALIGGVIGWQPVLVVFFLAPICAIVVVCFSFLTGRAREFPYGPWLSLAAVLLLVGWQWIWPVAGQFFMLGRFVPVLGFGCLLLLGVLLRGMRLLRGDEAYEEEYWELAEQWTSADQLIYQEQEQRDAGPTTWQGRQQSRWPGLESSRGRHGEQIWRGR